MSYTTPIELIIISNLVSWNLERDIFCTILLNHVFFNIFLKIYKSQYIYFLFYDITSCNEKIEKKLCNYFQR